MSSDSVSSTCTSTPPPMSRSPVFPPEPLPAQQAQIPDLAFHGRVETTTDALRLIYAAREGVIPRIRRRLNDSERRSMIKSGACFVFGVEESGIKRWTDGMLWSPSRIIQNYLVYREISERVNSRSSRRSGSHNNSLQSDGTAASDERGYQMHHNGANERRGADQDFKVGGLIKKTITVTVDNSDLHLISYFTHDDLRSGKLKRPTSRLDVMRLELPPHLFRGNNFRNPLKVEIGPDGRQRFTADADDVYDGNTAKSLGLPSDSASRASCKVEQLDDYDNNDNSPTWSSSSTSSTLINDSHSPVELRVSPSTSSSSSSTDRSYSLRTQAWESPSVSTNLKSRSETEPWLALSDAKNGANEPHWSQTLGYDNSTNNNNTGRHTGGRSSLHFVDGTQRVGQRMHHQLNGAMLSNGVSSLHNGNGSMHSHSHSSHGSEAAMHSSSSGMAMMPTTIDVPHLKIEAVDDEELISSTANPQNSYANNDSYTDSTNNRYESNNRYEHNNNSRYNNNGTTYRAVYPSHATAQTFEREETDSPTGSAYTSHQLKYPPIQQHPSLANYSSGGSFYATNSRNYPQQEDGTRYQ